MQPTYMVGCLFAIKKAQVCPMICNWLVIEVSVYILDVVMTVWTLTLMKAHSCNACIAMP